MKNQITKDAFVSILKQDMGVLHRNFETHSPNDHQKFLQSIGIPEAEIAMIRSASRIAV